jgi:protocatechuate 3,4-dioxygenase beta subunit
MNKHSIGNDRGPVLLSRRAVLAAFGAAVGGAALLAAACGEDDESGGDAGTAPDASGQAADGSAGSTVDAGPSSSSCDEIPDETAGPYPDTKGMISNQSFYRSDITEDRTGVPLTLTLTLVNVGSSCTPIANANVEIWHCDAAGVYSEYANNMNAGSTSTTYLRGVQTSDADGQVTFQTIYPGWYSGRTTHIHIQVYSGTSLVKTTQIGFPDAVNAAVYGVLPYSSKGLNSISDDEDQVFGNGNGSGDDGGGHDFQIASITGNTTNGYLATIAVGLASYP